MHVRGQLRARLNEHLGSIEGLADHVAMDTSEIPEEREAPWAHVTIGPETITRRMLNPPKFERETEFYVDLYGRDPTNPWPALEELGAKVETKLGNSPTLGGLVRSLTLRAIDPTEAADGSQPMGRYRLTFFCTYWTLTNDPSAVV